MKLKVPVGLINTSWGGSSCEAWVRRAVLEADPAYASLLASFDKRCAEYDPEAAKAAYQKQREQQELFSHPVFSFFKTLFCNLLYPDLTARQADIHLVVHHEHREGRQPV